MRVSVVGRKGTIIDVRDEVSGNDYSLDVKDWNADIIDYKAGTQINLIDVSVSDDALLVPSLLIYEPDMLVDISTIARCFMQYADSEKTTFSTSSVRRFRHAPRSSETSRRNCWTRL